MLQYAYEPVFTQLVQGAFHWLRGYLRDPSGLLWFAALVIAGYYAVTALFLQAIAAKKTKGLWKFMGKHGPVDIFTSVIWVVTPVFLIINMILVARRGNLTLDLLLIYYGLFIFLFAFLYCLAEWHRPGSLIGISEEYVSKKGDGSIEREVRRYEFGDSWNDELMYLIVSLQTQTALGYNRVRPNSALTEIIAGVQALVTLFFVAVAIAQAVNLTAPAPH